MLRLFNRFPVPALRLAVMLAAGVMAAAPVRAAEEAEPAAEMTKGEAELAKLLDGRVAGEPLRCVRTVPGQPMQTINGAAYVFGRGPTIYVQRTTRPQDIRDRYALQLLRQNTTSSIEVCRSDIVTTRDRALGITVGSVIFEDFIPYTLADARTGQD
ncbi:MAG: hypothetical protein ACXIT4_01630 [Erythrobacter sp.]